MPVSLPSSAQDRLLVFAPHPDDETIATGALIQAALRAGARVEVLFATDGDNNPWPQRWLERRWRIDADARVRWGARRRAEARAALERLAVAGHAADAHFLGWPDQGLTAMLMDHPQAIDALRDRITAFAPSHVAMPALGDAHPDHSALHVMAELALLQAGFRCVRLAYCVHGASAPDMLEIATDEPARACKRAAMEAYASQLALSRNRLVALAERAEAFEASPAGSTAIEGNPATITIACEPPRLRFARRELLLVLATRAGVLRFRHAVPTTSVPARMLLRDRDGHAIEADWDGHALTLELPRFARPLLSAWAKCDRGHPRLVVYDRERWARAPGRTRASVPALPAVLGHP
ncbi:MAG: PIG-L family deacetylase [Lysobacteraceae bacterium]|nr:MAG: PIG-L family deacetylase [Xanthomonadaceae bacterium]